MKKCQCRLAGVAMIILGVCVSLYAYFAKKEAARERTERAALSFASCEEERTLGEVIFETGILTGLPLIGLGMMIAQWPES